MSVASAMATPSADAGAEDPTEHPPLPPLLMLVPASWPLLEPPLPDDEDPPEPVEPPELVEPPEPIAPPELVSPPEPVAPPELLEPPEPLAPPEPLEPPEPLPLSGGTVKEQYTPTHLAPMPLHLQSSSVVHHPSVPAFLGRTG